MIPHMEENLFPLEAVAVEFGKLRSDLAAVIQDFLAEGFVHLDRGDKARTLTVGQVWSHEVRVFRNEVVFRLAKYNRHARITARYQSKDIT